MIELQSTFVIKSADGTNTTEKIDYYLPASIPPTFNPPIASFLIFVRHYPLIV